MNRTTLRLGTRASALALAQSQLVANELAVLAGRPVELITFTTRGDAITDRPLVEVGGKGLFTQELETALVSGDIDLAVHSLKDLPSVGPEGLILGAVPRREDPRDVIIGQPLAELAHGARVGTGSLRRKLQLLALRPDLEILDIRGNVDTRINKQRRGDFASILLAAAGLARLGRSADVAEFLAVETMIPAPGQGALALQCRESDSVLRTWLSGMHDFATAVCILAERSFLATLSGGCSVPAACHARLIGHGHIELLAFHGEGSRTVLRGEAEDAEELGRQAAEIVRPRA